jgi:hypothetical protein
MILSSGLLPKKKQRWSQIAHTELLQKVGELEHRLESHDEQIQAIFEAIRQLMTPPAKPRKKIGFVVKEKKAAYGKRTKGTRRKK